MFLIRTLGESGSPGGSEVKNLLAKQEVRVPSLGCKDSLEKEISTHSNVLTWKIPCTEEPGWLQSMWSQDSEMI